MPADTKVAGPIRVFLVDDHRVVRSGVSAYLEQVEDIEVIGEAADGRQALDRIAQLEPGDNLPDVVLMDLMMPVMDGITATRQVKSRWPAIEVVAMTSFVEEAKVRGALEAGAAGYLLKDADADEVAQAIRAAVAGQMHLDPIVARLLADSVRGPRRPEASPDPEGARGARTGRRGGLEPPDRKGSIIRNVAALADPPKLSSAKKRAMRVWDADQLRAFLSGIQQHRLYPAYYLAANTGMRRGEVLGLRWRDVDLDARRLSVHQALISVAYSLQIADVKTGSSRRTIDLDPRTIAVLRSWRKRQLEERLALGELHEDLGLVFARPEGAPIHPDLFSKTFDRMALRSGLPVIRLHDLRHSHASLLLKSRVPVKVVSERLGHATPAFTMTVYQHVLPGMQAEAATTFADLVFGPEYRSENDG